MTPKPESKPKPRLIRRLVGRILRAQRRQVGLSQVELAATLGCKQAKLSSLERGKTPITMEHLALCADPLGLRPGDVLWFAHLVRTEWDPSAATLDHWVESNLGILRARVKARAGGDSEDDDDNDNDNDDADKPVALQAPVPCEQEPLSCGCGNDWVLFGPQGSAPGVLLPAVGQVVETWNGVADGFGLGADEVQVPRLRMFAGFRDFTPPGGEQRREWFFTPLRGEFDTAPLGAEGVVSRWPIPVWPGPQYWRPSRSTSRWGLDPELCAAPMAPVVWVGHLWLCRNPYYPDGIDSHTLQQYRERGVEPVVGRLP